MAVKAEPLDRLSELDQVEGKSVKIVHESDRSCNYCHKSGFWKADCHLFETEA